MDFYLKDFVDDTKEVLKGTFPWIREDERVAVAAMESEYYSYSKVAGKWEDIQKLIPLIAKMEYDDFHLYYDDCEIWVLEWHNPEHDGARWFLGEAY